MRIKLKKLTNMSLLFFLARANSFYLADIENISEWTEKDFETLIYSAHLCHIAPTLGITLQCYFFLQIYHKYPDLSLRLLQEKYLYW